MDKKEMASKIEHTILKADATKQQVLEICSQARDNGFVAVCVNPAHIQLVASELKDSGVKTCAVIGFPLGANTSEVKAFEAAMAVKAGAEEVDMVINVGALKDGDDDYVENDIRGVVQAAGKAAVKVIIETCCLTHDEKVRACRLAVNAGAAFVKTSTGFGTAGATAEDVALMRSTVGKNARIKAAGGIRSLKAAMEMVNAGADRIGTSSGIKIIGEME